MSRAAGAHDLARDQAVTEIAGPFVEHIGEYLALSDILRMRRRLLDAARASADDGIVPPGVDDAEVFWKARAGSFHVDAKSVWPEEYREQLNAAIGSPAPA
jgi:hypothetical protein